MAKTTVSIVADKGGFLKHNNRENISDNVDLNKKDENITLVKKDIASFYEEIFGEAIAASDKNKRKREQIGSSQAYMEKIKQSKNGESLFHEKVIMVGKKEDIESNPDLEEVYKKILLEYFKDFEQRNPNLKVFNAVLHMDEATPHLHIDYVPVGTEFKKGLQMRNSRSKAYCELTKEENSALALKSWFKSERELLRGICGRFGIETEQIKKDDEKNRPKLSPREYRAVMDQQTLLAQQKLEKLEKELKDREFYSEQLEKNIEIQSARIANIEKAVENQKILDDHQISDLEKFIEESYQSAKKYNASDDLFDFTATDQSDVDRCTNNQTR